MAQENEWQKKVAYPTDESQYYGRTTSTCETKKTVANVRVRMLPFGRTAQKRARVRSGSLGLGNQRRVAAVTAHGGRWKAREHSGNGRTNVESQNRE